MKFVRYVANGETSYGLVEGDVVKRLTGTPFEEYEVSRDAQPLRDVRLLAPCAPTKGLAIGLNYRSHLGDSAAPKRPEPFYKTPNCFIGSGEAVLLPPDAGRVDEEAELVVVMGRRCKGVRPTAALDYVLGYTCGLDISAREWQMGPDRDRHFWRAKAADTFGPIGPVIETDFDPASFEVSCRIDGEQVQHCQSHDMIFDVATIVSFISQSVTLEPGDVIFTGTAGTTVALKPGDTIEVEIPGIGVLRNPVLAAPGPA